MSHTTGQADQKTGQVGKTFFETPLGCNPSSPACPRAPARRLAVSASYDGDLILWDLQAGALLRRLSSRGTRPDGRSWPDPLPLTDGHFAPDGAGFVVTDVAGQLHYYGWADGAGRGGWAGAMLGSLPAHWGAHVSPNKQGLTLLRWLRS